MSYDSLCLIKHAKCSINLWNERHQRVKESVMKKKGIYLVIPWLWKVVASVGSTWGQNKCRNKTFYSLLHFPHFCLSFIHTSSLSASLVFHAATLTRLPWPTLDLYCQGALALARQMRQFCSHTSLSVSVEWMRTWGGNTHWTWAINGIPAAKKS